MTLSEIAAEYETWLAEQPDTPAKRWCLDNKPSVGDVARVVHKVEHQGFGLTRITLAA